MDNSSILFCCKFPPPYDGQTINTQSIYELIKKKINVEIYNMSDPERNFNSTGKFSIRFLFLNIKHLIKAKNIVKKGGIDVFYYITPSSSFGIIRDAIMLSLVKRNVKKIIATVHRGNLEEGFQNLFIRIFMNLIVNKTDKFIFQSEFIISKIKEYIPFDKILKIRNPINAKRYIDDSEILNKYNVRRKSEIINILYLSNMIESKGYFDLLKALSYLSDTLDWSAKFIGKWNNNIQKEGARSFIKRNNLLQKIEILGVVSDPIEIKQYLLEADIFILPTYYPIEAQPMSIIEALNSGTPVISTRHASIPEFIIDDYNGYLVEKKNPLEIKDAIVKLADKDNWIIKAKNARKTFLEEFQTSIIRDQYLRILKV